MSESKLVAEITKSLNELDGEIAAAKRVGSDAFASGASLAKVMIESCLWECGYQRSRLIDQSGVVDS